MYKSILKVLVVIMIQSTLMTALIFADENTKINDAAKKKIVFVKDDDGEFFNAIADLIKNLLANKGYTADNSEYITLSIGAKIENIDSVTKKIIEIKPDVILFNGAFGLREFTGKLKESKIPIIIGISIEAMENGRYMFIDKKNNPISNVTGLYTMPENYEKNVISLLNAAAPLNKNKAVMIMPEFWNKEPFVKAFKELKLSLKAYETPRYFEEAKKLVQKYNKDKSVGWIIMDNAFSFKDSSKEITSDMKHRWIAENVNKPGAGFYQVGVENGQLCGIAIDSFATVERIMDMADRILKGEGIQNVKAEHPPKTLIMLNQMTAKRIGVEFPPEVVSGAYRIYIDYDGNFIGKK